MPEIADAIAKYNSDYTLARLEAKAEHEVFTDPKGIEPMVVYCPEKKGFTYTETLCEVQDIQICGHCHEVIIKAK